MMRSSRSFRALPLAILLATTAVGTVLMPGTGRADWVSMGQWSDGNGTTYTVYYDDKSDDLATIAENAKGAVVSFSVGVADWVIHNAAFKKSSDPGPDDNGKGTEPVNVAGLIEKGLVTYKVKVTPENTPLAKWLDSQGGGFSPHWNPSDDDNKGPGHAPTVNTGGPTDKQKQSFAKLMNEAAKQLNALGHAMGDVGDLGSENAPGLPSNKNSNNNRNNNGGGNGQDNKNGQKKILGSDLSLGPRPDLVNPPHSRTSHVIGAGLLESNSSFSNNGPAAMGAPLAGHGVRR